MKVSVIIPTYKRTHLLRWGLESLAKQDITCNYEILVLNDGLVDDTEDLVNQYKDRLNIRYLYTGQRHSPGRTIWRCPGFTINIGVKHTDGDVLIFCCAEMFHLNSTIDLLSVVYQTPGTDKILAIPQAKDDDSRFLRQLEKSSGNFSIADFNAQPPLENVKFPFLLAMRRTEFEGIGGYDEDFTGTDYDDSDLIDRMVANGCTHKETNAMTVHLWHPRLVMSAERIPRFKHNEDLYFARKGVIIRNVGRNWGVLK